MNNAINSKSVEYLTGSSNIFKLFWKYFDIISGFKINEVLPNGGDMESISHYVSQS